MILITGSTGLIGSAASEFYLNKNKKVLGIDNDLRSYFFGKKSSNKWKIEYSLENSLEQMIRFELNKLKKI